MRKQVGTPTISIIIPVYKDDATLAVLLQNLQGMDVAEIIIADGEARSHVPHSLKTNISDNICFKLIWLAAAPKGRGSQIQMGIERSKSDYIWILHADSHLAPNAPQAIHKTLANAKTSLGTFTLKFDATSPTLSVFAWMSRIDSPLSTFGDQGFFFRRKDYNALNLNLSQFPLLEDVALRRALKQTGRVVRAQMSIITSARRFAQRGIWKTQLFNTQILWRYMCGESPAALYRDYYQAPIETTRPAPQTQTTIRA